MRTNGFIFIALGFTAACMAGSPGYLPSVGPVGLRFENPATASRAVALPAPAPFSDVRDAAATRLDVADLPVETPTNSAPTTTALMLDVPVVLPDAVTGLSTNPAPLIGPLMDTNNVVTPQMFLRFFTPAQGGTSQEAIIIPPAGFSPARPPTPSSTATYTQPKP